MKKDKEEEEERRLLQIVPARTHLLRHSPLQNEHFLMIDCYLKTSSFYEVASEMQKIQKIISQFQNEIKETFLIKHLI